MDKPAQATASYTVSVSASATGTGGFRKVNDLERAILGATRTAGREVYGRAFAALQRGLAGLTPPALVAGPAPTSLRPQSKPLLVSTQPLALFGRQSQLQAHRLFAPDLHLLLSDGDEGLQRLREDYFPHQPWLLGRWRVAQAVRTFTGSNQDEFHRLMRPVWEPTAKRLWRRRAPGPLRHQRLTQFQPLFGWLLGHRDGIDARRLIPAGLRRGRGRRPPALKAGSGGRGARYCTRNQSSVQTPRAQ